ncbi:hypothetical protein [Actinobacillus porcinus]|uniref:hypothetical protein n=1 Tax=Actinobacillus porcinus TaxID=51048 RepID=UPI002A908C1B|nr:hypothetical protein [Actinobacillus porcinus]MDY6216764.1 hypothetical protein [Actinobacillus porcinus]
MFFEIFGSVILGCALMVIGLCLIRSSSYSGNQDSKNVCDDLKKIKNFLCSSFGFGSFIIFLGFAIFASWDLDEIIDEIIKDQSSFFIISFFSSIYDYLYEFIPWLFDALKHVSLNSFWSILWAGLGLTIILDDLKKRGSIDSSPEEDTNKKENLNDQKDK